MNNSLVRLLIAILISTSTTSLWGQNPTETESIKSLSSPSQTERDLAAEELRKTHNPSPKSKWDNEMSQIKKGITKKQVLEIFKAHNTEVTLGIGSVRIHSEMYQLDNDWMLSCWYENESNILNSFELSMKTKSAWVQLSDDNFTGKWITYFINGQKAHEIDYKDGKYFGKFISYHSDGNIRYVQHYDSSGCNGTDIGYYPSGQIMYKGEYKKGKQCGIWTHYDEKGNITSQKKHRGC